MHNHQMPFNDTKTLIREKKDYYNALERNGFKMPSYKCKYLTSEVMMMIRQNQIYCPKYVDLDLRACPNPPSEKQVRDDLVTLISDNLINIPPNDQPRFQMFIRELNRALPDRQWMLEVISTLSKGNHPYFAKSYMPPVQMKNNFAANINVANDDNFFTDLPASKAKGSRGGVFVMTAQQKQEQKIQRMQHSQQQQAQRLAAEQQKLVNLQNNAFPMHQQRAQPMPQQRAQPMPGPNMVPQYRAQQNMMQQQVNQPVVEEQKDDGKIEEVEMNHSPSRQIGRDISNMQLQGNQNGRHRPRNAKVQALADYGIHPNVIRNESV